MNTTSIKELGLTKQREVVPLVLGMWKFTHKTKRVWEMYRLTHNQNIIELLIKLRGLGAEYPSELLSAQRNLFIQLLSHCILKLTRM